MYGSHNTANNASITNNKNGVMYFYGNDLASSTIKNDGQMTIGDCSFKNQCREGYTNGTNASNISKFENNGTLNLGGNINFHQSTLYNRDTSIINAENVNISGGDAIFYSSGVINFSGSNIIDIDTNNTGEINLNKGDTYYKKYI